MLTHPSCRLLLAPLLLIGFLFAGQNAYAQNGERLRQWLAQRHGAAPMGEGVPAGGDEAGRSEHFSFGGRDRAYLVHVPRSYRAGTPVPLVLALHGGGGSMEHMARDQLYGLISKSDEAGFIVVFPNGISPLGNGMMATWNAGNCCGAARDASVDDVGFLRAVVGRVERQYSVDHRRIFAIGMSNGGMMAYRLACEAGDLFAGIMAVAGTDNTRSCTPSRPVPVLHIHARNDDHVLFNGGAGPGARNGAAITDFTAVPDTVAKWVRLNRAAPHAQRVLDRPGATCERHGGAAPVQLCVTEAGGHSWPGGNKPRGEAPSRAISANDVMWDFFSTL